MSAGGQPIQSYFFPGQTDNRALIIGGVHGSELSGTEVVETLLNNLTTGPRPFYSVIVVPSLFPDNADVARSQPAKIESEDNIGRLTKGSSVDPNREFPVPGKRYDPADPKDAEKRQIEPENRMLMELINRFKPSRIASVHSTHTLGDAGIYADPRSDAKGKALGYDSDKDLAFEMAKNAAGKGANVPGNDLSGKKPNAIYPSDPAPAAAGKKQKRTDHGDKGSKGYSLGGWGSTAICDPAHPDTNRPAMRIITIEMQTANRVKDLPAAQQAGRLREVEAVADTLREIFLGDKDVEGSQDPCASAVPATP